MTAPEGAEPVIHVTENGPYRVEGGIPVRNADGEPVEAPSRYFLCRCGHSSNKPFCDGTHNKIGFAGEETADQGPIAGRRDAYHGTGVTVYDDRSVCAHSGHCTDNLAAVFRLRTEPWIDAAGSDADSITAVIDTCPSGALSYSRDGSEPVEEQSEPGVTPSKDGPYWIAGAVQVVSAEGDPYERRPRQTLCRCGGSKNKPFCDGTHWHIGFKAG